MGHQKGAPGWSPRLSGLEHTTPNNARLFAFYRLTLPFSLGSREHSYCVKEESAFRSSRGTRPAGWSKARLKKPAAVMVTVTFSVPVFSQNHACVPFDGARYETWDCWTASAFRYVSAYRDVNPAVRHEIRG